MTRDSDTSLSSSFLFAPVVFGPKKLLEVALFVVGIGKTVKSFQQAVKEFESKLKKEPDSEGGGSSHKSIATVET
ncbi:hypothetical protein RJT34_22777 [Clitoria ternatea]|uniref:Uncharacterized protein n=1 Tax=Clitoria ternatea TaxID=43366 RepID=A0AAN9FKK9_CLITE